MSSEDIRKELKLLRRKTCKVNNKEDLKKKYEGAIAMLPPSLVRVMNLYYIEGKSYGEIAGEIFYSSDTVRRRVRQGEDMLAKIVK